MDAISLKSPAKVNLFLYISGRDVRGYHRLQSLFYRINSLHDIISISLNTSGILSLNSNVEIQDNIILKAAKILLTLINNEAYGFEINLQKNIPIGAGLGGGSSNAATVMLGINKLLDYPLTTNDLIKLSENIGDDVKFFLMEEDSIMFDDNKIYSIELDIHPKLLLVKPNFSISTAQVYQLYREVYKDIDLYPTILDGDLIPHITHGANHLYDIVKKFEPRIEKVISAIKKQGGIARMSGSGSTCFGIFKTSEELKNAAINLQQSHEDWFVYHAKDFPSRCKSLFIA